MKKAEEIQLPDELRYSVDHEWVRMESGSARIGITDYAQDQLGDVVYVELPSIGARFAAGAVFATVESVKSVSECIMPLAGEVIGVNAALNDDPALLNTSPYGDGWMVLVKPDDPSAGGGLLTAGRYREHLGGAA